MILNIIPATRLPRSTDFFSYSVPVEVQKNVRVGQIIEVNFRGKNIPGLVIKIDKNKKFKYPLKSINKILYPGILVTPQQIKLLDFMCNYYASAKSIVVKSMLPDVPKRQKTLKQKNTLRRSLSRAESRGSGQVKTLKQKGGYKKDLVWYANVDEIYNILKNKIKHKKQILILVPQIEMINNLMNKLNLDEKRVIKIHNSIAKIKFFKYWLDILSGQPKIIIGTKISVLLPWANLNEIIVYNSHDWNHKQSDINPRFDARIVAQWLALEHGCQLTLATPAPSIETYKSVETLKHPSAEFIPSGVEGLRAGESIKANIKIVNLKDERLKGNYSALSDELVNHIKKSKKTFLFHNRKGLAQFVICEDCGRVFKCPECDISLAYHNQDKKLYCHHCGFSQDMAPLCPKCQGPNIKFRGQGIDRIKFEVQKLLPAAKILTIDKSVKQFSTGQSDIVIGTEFVMNKIDFSQFNLIGFINFDQLINRPDFRAQENAYQIFYEIKSQASQADFLIQTYDIENVVIKSIAQNNPKVFYNTELSHRKNLNYPPFNKIIKLTYQDKKEKNVLYKTKKLILDLKKSQVLEAKTIEVLGPFANLPKKVSHKFKYHIILKTPINFDIQKIVKIIPTDFIIDIEPEKLI